MNIKSFIIAVLCFALTACNSSEADDFEDSPVLPTTPKQSGQTGAVVETQGEFQALLSEYQALNQRVENVAYRLLSANYDQCPQTQRSIGLQVHTVSEYPEDLQPYAGALLGVMDAPSVRLVAAGSPAERAGLRSGDQIIAIDDIEMVDGPSAKLFYEAVRAKSHNQPSLKMTIERAGEVTSANVVPETVCGYPVHVFFDEDVNAYTDGEEIWISSELVRRVEDDAGLAQIIAHELAHAAMGHVFLEPDKVLELEADRLSMFYAAMAGFDPELVLDVWQSNPYNHVIDQTVDTHPSPEERFAVLRAALLDISDLDEPRPSRQ